MEILSKQMKLEIRGINKSFGNVAVLQDIDFELKKGEFLSIIGPSGCGKTTLLRILVGIESADSGCIRKDGLNIESLPAAKRGMGMVFQNYALFPNMTVEQNIKYALKFNKELKENTNTITEQMIKLMGLTEVKNNKPHKLSGGQQQRVAIARTLVLNPDIILFDEAMSALDAETRIGLRKEIKRIQKQFKVSIIYITHDQEEACAMSDRIMIMNKGKVIQIGTPKEVYHNPVNEFVNNFVTLQISEKIKSLKECVEEPIEV